jgi:hypothetical protein
MALALYGAPAVALDCLAGFYSAGPLARHYLGIIDATRRFLAERGAAALLWRLGPGRRFGKGPMTLRNLCGALGGSPSRVGGWRREILGSLSAILGEARAAFLEGFRDLEESLPLGMLYFRLQRDKMVGSVSGKYSPLGLWDGSRRRRLWPLGSAGPPLGPGPAPGPGALAGGVPRPGLRDSLRDILDLLRHVPPGRG